VVPAASFFVALLLVYSLSHNVIGLVMLGFNVAFLVWARKRLHPEVVPAIRALPAAV
jgi:hypothetical protein